MTRFYSVVLFAVTAFCGKTAGQFVPADTLEALLQANGVKNLRAVPDAARRMYIGNGNLRFYGAVSNASEFAFAGYLLPTLPGANDGPNDPRIHVVLAEKTSQRVRYAAIATEPTFAGSIQDIRLAEATVYVTTHLNPSAMMTFVLTRNLELQRELYGWPLATVANDNIVFQNSQVHFAPPHILELSAYDPARRVETKFFPPAKPDPVRADFVRRVRAAYVARGEDWFRINNHHMNPELFDSYLAGFAVDEKAHALAFLVQYDNPINDAGDPLSSRQDVVATCTSLDSVERISCKERPLEDWAKALQLAKSDVLRESSQAKPVMDQLLRRAAAAPDTVR
ncbi:MAG: hypothetical protein HYU27_00340 [Acidobacteria bacterium]|nr:hypothetical protein [Acidobacteriota bacterium]